MKGKLLRYCLNWLCVMDTTINVAFAGDYRETCSSRLGRKRAEGIKPATVIAEAVDWVALHVFGQKDHCARSVQPEFDHSEEVWK